MTWVPYGLIDHFWQSTLFVVAAWLVTRTLRANRARVRYWLWIAASIKFLIPASILVRLGGQLAWRTAPAATTHAVSFVIDQVLTPASTATAVASVAPIAGVGATMLTVCVTVWASGMALVLMSWWRQWLPIRRALADAQAIPVRGAWGAGDLPIMASPTMIEPGVFGIRRPVLLVPAGLVDRLAPAQLRALIAHERCHVRYGDNLTAAIHMGIEAIFWFHPLVWWIERRLIDERERACDEYVLQSGSVPRDYAEGILAACRFAKESPLACVAGISGSDLRRRLELIVAEDFGRALTPRRRIALAAAIVACITGPVAVGAMQAPSVGGPQATVRAPRPTTAHPTFDVTSVKPNNSGDQRRGGLVQPGRFVQTNVTLHQLIGMAYRLGPGLQQEITGGPDWLNTRQFDVEGKGEFALDAYLPGPKGEPPRAYLMLQALLEDRFKLAVHTEHRERPVYALMLNSRDRRLGKGLQLTDIDCAAALASAVRSRRRPTTSGQPAQAPPCSRRIGPGRLNGNAIDMNQLAESLSSMADRVVVNRTGLDGVFNVDLEWTPAALA